MSGGLLDGHFGVLLLFFLFELLFLLLVHFFFIFLAASFSHRLSPIKIIVHEEHEVKRLCRGAPDRLSAKPGQRAVRCYASLYYSFFWSDWNVFRENIKKTFNSQYCARFWKGNLKFRGVDFPKRLGNGIKSLGQVGVLSLPL